jgi:hypothetical protein
VTPDDQEALAIGRCVLAQPIENPRRDFTDEEGNRDSSWVLAVSFRNDFIAEARAAGVAAITPEPQPAEEKQP